MVAVRRVKFLKIAFFSYSSVTHFVSAIRQWHNIWSK